MRKSSLIVFFFVVAGSAAFAQLRVVPVSKTGPKKNLAARTAQVPDTIPLAPIALPFWDDFSFSNSVSFPHDTIWQYGQSVTLNDGVAIKPPSHGVVTFDGLDSIGRAYDLSNPLNKGLADKLVSRPLRLDLVPPAGRDSVHMSFFYQAYGNGEDPDVPGDYLSVDFLNVDTVWNNVLTINRNETQDPTKFYYTQIKISDPQYFHQNFQFRFRNFGRLSGPYDTWNVDYVYVNDNISDTTVAFPDRTVSTGLGSLLKTYYAIPAKHFVADIAGNLEGSQFSVYNLSRIEEQSTGSYFTGDVVSYLNSTPSHNTVDSTFLNVGGIPTMGNLTIGFPIPDSFVDKFQVTADSFKIAIKLVLNSSDNIPIGQPFGDYDPTIFDPIEFRINDTTKLEQYLTNYYAYDDGSAEYGIGLNAANTQVMYQFDMVTPAPDTVVAVDLYFPHFGDETNQTLLLRILRDLSDTDESVLYEETIPVLRSEHNTFYRHVLDRRTVGVQGTFYVGWKQSVVATIPIGWDKNTDSGEKIWFNTNGLWEQNQEQGSMMIRPVFGKGDIPTGIADVPELNAYPNPSSGTFFLSGQPEGIQLIDLAGKQVSFQSERMEKITRVTLDYPQVGMYILKTVVNGRVVTQKIMVRP